MPTKCYPFIRSLTHEHLFTEYLLCARSWTRLWESTVSQNKVISWQLKISQRRQKPINESHKYMLNWNCPLMTEKDEPTAVRHLTAGLHSVCVGCQRWLPWGKDPLGEIQRGGGGQLGKAEKTRSCMQTQQSLCARRHVLKTRDGGPIFFKRIYLCQKRQEERSPELLAWKLGPSLSVLV